MSWQLPRGAERADLVLPPCSKPIFSGPDIEAQFQKKGVPVGPAHEGAKGELARRTRESGCGTHRATRSCSDPPEEPFFYGLDFERKPKKRSWWVPV